MCETLKNKTLQEQTLIKNNQFIILAIFNKSYISPLLYLNLEEHLKNCPDICNVIVKKMPQMYKYMPEHIKAMDGITHDAIMQDGRQIEHAPNTLRSHPIFITNAMINNKEAYKFILPNDDDCFKKDYEKIYLLDDENDRYTYCTLLGSKYFISVNSKEPNKVELLHKLYHSRFIHLIPDKKQLAILCLLAEQPRLYERLESEDKQILIYQILFIIHYPDGIEQLSTEFQKESFIKSIAQIGTFEQRYMKALEKFGELIMVAPDEIRYYDQSIITAMMSYPQAHHYGSMKMLQDPMVQELAKLENNTKRQLSCKYAIANIQKVEQWKRSKGENASTHHIPLSIFNDTLESHQKGQDIKSESSHADSPII